jgi:hypothetical protein
MASQLHYPAKDTFRAFQYWTTAYKSYHSRPRGDASASKTSAPQGPVLRIWLRGTQLHKHCRITRMTSRHTIALRSKFLKINFTQTTAFSNHVLGQKIWFRPLLNPGFSQPSSPPNGQSRLYRKSSSGPVCQSGSEALALLPLFPGPK